MDDSDACLFLDTTIQIDRFLTEPEKSIRLKEILSQVKELCTSTYVKMEYRRSLIQDLVFLFNDALSDAEHFGEVFLRINRLHSLQQRRISRMTASLIKFFFEKEDEISNSLGKEHLEILRHYLRPLIEHSMEFFDDDVNYMVNGTDCYNAKLSPSLQGEKFDNRTHRFKSSEIKCKIVEFFQQNKGEFQKIYKKLSLLQQLDSEQIKMRETLKKALQYPQNMANCKNCWGCADSIIAVECPNDSLLFTTNRKHFEPICQEINKKMADFKY